jgi:photosystem II stability/assembly factor-like uncharacterized protein
MKLHTAFSSALKGLIVLSIVLFLSAAGFQDKMTSGWYQQYFPNLNGSTIKDMTFLDSLTGFAITTTNSSVQAYILKTSNGGDNWSIVHSYFPPSTGTILTGIMFANNAIGYASTSYHEFFKTTNAGENWTNISEPPWSIDGLYVLNTDTVFAASSSPFGGGVFRSTNGGYNWQTIWNIGGGSGNPEKIYMVNKDMGFIQDEDASSYMKRTTNGGFNWTSISGERYYDIIFFDINTGWKVYDSIKKTTNGGTNWFVQQHPNNYNEIYNPSKITILNKDTVWMVGAYTYGGVVFKTTNGGTNWGYQFPNPNIATVAFHFIQFVDPNHGWVNTNNILLHTKVGGNDTTIFTGINSNSDVLISDYQLYQNYPNPFNPSTIISYKLAKSGNIRIKVFDISGKEIEELVNKKLQAGSYKITFNLTKYSSGIYFYSMIIDGTVVDTKKMMYVK